MAHRELITSLILNVRSISSAFNAAEKLTDLADQDGGGRAGLSRWLPLAAVALCLAVAVGYCVAKRGYFVDEVWSYGYANSHYARVLSDTRGGDLAGATLTRRDLLDYV